MQRRNFLKSAAALGAFGAVRPIDAFGSTSQEKYNHFGVHAFVEEHPDAVFVMKTDVDIKTNSEAKKETGLRFARSVILPMDETGIPLTHLIPIKPNLTDSSCSNKDFTLEYGMGIVNDPYFIEGVIEGMKELGMEGSQFYLREVNAPNNFEPRGYTDMAKHTGADIRDLDTDVREMPKENIQWKDVPAGVIHRKIPYLWPVNAPDTFFLNIAKFKTHSTGLTLCCKNHQGSVANKYQRFCHGFVAFRNYHYDHLAPNVEERCKALYDEHLTKKLPYWSTLETMQGDSKYWLDAWCQRTLDNLSTTPMGLCVIEGIYGREGCFLFGPNPPENNDKGKKEARDYMTNIIMFGKDPILVDIIGHWLGGHEPGHFGFFHIAMERGMSAVLDPRKIPVYLWEDGEATLLPLETFPRTPLRSDYLPKEGAFSQNKIYSMYDEPFDYSSVNEQVPAVSLKPGVRVLERCLPGNANPFIAVEYTLPVSNYSHLEILNENGDSLETLINGYRHKGAHCAVWHIQQHNSGKYYCRFRTGDFTDTSEFMLRKS